MLLIEDLGMRVVGSKGKKYRFGLYKCPVCHKHFECDTASVKIGRSTKCRSCASIAINKKAIILAESTFATRANIIHNGIYNYTLVEYLGTENKIKIICHTHGVFLQTPHSHLAGQGCPHCSAFTMRGSLLNTRPTKLYYIFIHELDLWKIGCTTKDSIIDRFTRDDITITELVVREYLTGAEAYFIESYILGSTRDFAIKDKPLKSKGNSELRIQSIPNIIVLIEEAEALYKILSKENK